MSIKGQTECVRMTFLVTEVNGDDEGCIVI